MQKLTPADKSQYQDLVSSCADQVPPSFLGRHDVEQLPKLTPADIACVCRHEDDTVEYLIDDLDLSQLGSVAGDECELGRRMAALLELACRKTIAYDVMCEIESREIAREQALATRLRGSPLEAL